MERAEVFQVMQDKAGEMLEVEPAELREATSFVDDLHLDSLSLVEYTMDLEDALGIELPEEELVDLTTVGQFLDVIMGKLSTALNADG